MSEELGTETVDAAATAAADTQTGTQTTENGQQDQAVSPFAELQDEDTRTWLEKRGIKDVASLAKQTREQDKLLGNAIRVPGKDATQEERDAFLNKLGRPEKPEDYAFSVPESLPEDLPYDGERDKVYAAKAHELGLTKAQAAGLREWFVSATVEDFNTSLGLQAERTAEAAKAETAKLEKLWGPLDGEQMKTQLSFADKALREVGGADVLAEFQRVGLIGAEGNMILSAPIATMMAKVGQALYKEDEVMRGDVTRLENPFAEGKNFNVTAQMAAIRRDEAHARSLMAAAGKKPSDFGLKD